MAVAPIAIPGSNSKAGVPHGAVASVRLQSIDVLRGIAALAVVLFHCVGDDAPSGNPVYKAFLFAASMGYVGVPLFFVISGYCIHMNWVRRFCADGSREISFKAFWKRRMRRLYPPYVIVLCLSTALLVVALVAGRSVQMLADYPDPKPQWMLVDFVTHIAMLHQFHGDLDRAGGNPPFWSLAREEVFYILYFGLLAWRRAWTWRYILTCVFLLGIIVDAVLSPIMPTGAGWNNVVHHSALTLWIQWCLGMIAVEAAFAFLRS